MKKISIIVICTLLSICSYSQYTWSRKANFPGTARYYGTGFNIGNYLFMGCGTNLTLYFNDFYKWNKVTNTWTAIANYPGTGYEFCPISFTIDGKGYVGLGWNGTSGSNDLWSYDTTTNVWTQMATFPGTGRDDGSVFVIGHKAYLIGGSTGGPPYLQDVWVYDAHTNTWTQKNNSPAGKLDALITFAIGNHGYIGGGFDGTNYYTASWEYDTTSDTWTSIAAFPLATGIGGDPRTFVIGSKAYLANGTTAGGKTIPDGYCYDTVSRTWSVFTNLGANEIERGYTAAFAIGNIGYMTTGKDSASHYLADLWQWAPLDTTIQCDSWTQRLSYAGAARNYGAGFSIGNYAFLGCGTNGTSYYNDFYKWNQSTDAWSSIANYPGVGYEFSPISFTIEGKGYVGLGWDGSGGATDLWRYDTITNSWASMATFPGSGRDDGSVFVIGHKAYLISGSKGSPPYYNDVWVYDAHTNTWTQKNNSPAGFKDALISFAIGNHGYIGGGFDGTSYYNSCWEYDTASDTWTSIAAFPLATGIGGDPRTFVLGGKAYVCNGTTTGSKTISDGYFYDTATRAWSFFSNMGSNGIERGYSAAFTIGRCGFIGTGRDSLGTMLNDYWEYCPCTDTSITTGVIHYQNKSAKVSVYPNPSSGIIHVKYILTDAQEAQFRITDIFGRIVNTYTMNAMENEMILDQTSLSNGIYFYQVINPDKIAISGKFIISK